MRNRDNERGGVNSAPARKGRSPRESAKAARESIDGPVRRCILSGEHDARPHMIRLALAPDGRVLPDVRAKAPGRGGWIGVTRGELETAIAKGKLKGALARAFKTGEFSIPDDLPDLIASALERNALDRLGLESRSGMLLTGSDKIATAARSGQLHALYHASDAGDDGCRKLAQAWRVGSDREGSDLKGLALPATRPILSMALGRENVVHIGLTDRNAAKRMSEALDRWLHFIGPDPVATPCETASQGASASDITGDRTAVTVHEDFE